MSRFFQWFSAHSSAVLGTALVVSNSHIFSEGVSVCIRTIASALAASGK